MAFSFAGSSPKSFGINVDPDKEELSINAVEATQPTGSVPAGQVTGAKSSTGNTLSGGEASGRTPGRSKKRIKRVKASPGSGGGGKASSKEGQKLLSRFAKMAELSGKGGGNIKGLQELQAAGIGTAVVSQTFRDPNSLATMAIRKGLLQGPGGASREIAKTRFNGLEISVFTDQKTARLARMIGATLKSRAKQRRRPRR